MFSLKRSKVTQNSFNCKSYHCHKGHNIVSLQISGWLCQFLFEHCSCCITFSWGDVNEYLLIPDRHWWQSKEAILPKSSLIIYRNVGDKGQLCYQEAHLARAMTCQSWTPEFPAPLAGSSTVFSQKIHYNFSSLEQGPCESCKVKSILSLVCFTWILSLRLSLCLPGGNVSTWGNVCRTLLKHHCLSV